MRKLERLLLEKKLRKIIFLIINVILIVIIIWKSLMVSLKRYIMVSSRLLMQTCAFTHTRVSFIARTQQSPSRTTAPFLVFASATSDLHYFTLMPLKRETAQMTAEKRD